jgi:hypothetical protein
MNIDSTLKKALADGDIPAAQARWDALPEPHRPSQEGLNHTLWTMARTLPPTSAAWLVSQGAQPDQVIRDKVRGLSDCVTVAIAGRNFPLLTWLFTEGGVDPNRQLPAVGPTPFIEAIQAGVFDALPALVALGMDTGSSTIQGNTALHWAAHHYKVEACVALVELGVDPRIRNKMGHLACELVPEDRGEAWRPDDMFEFLDGYREHREQGQTTPYPIPEAVLDERAVERVGLEFTAKAPSQWTPEEARAARVLSDRGVLNTPAVPAPVRPTGF